MSKAQLSQCFDNGRHAEEVRTQGQHAGMMAMGSDCQLHSSSPTDRCQTSCQIVHQQCQLAQCHESSLTHVPRGVIDMLDVALAGYSNIPLDAAKARGIPVCNAPGGPFSHQVDWPIHRVSDLKGSYPLAPLMQLIVIAFLRPVTSPAVKQADAPLCYVQLLSMHCESPHT